MRRSLLAALWLTLSFLLGCAHSASSPYSSLEAASRALENPSASAREHALGAFHAYLVEGDAKKAKGWFDLALAKDSSDPYALSGQLLLARRIGQAAQQLSFALDLCERAPKHPLASTGARLVLDLTGLSPALDDTILTRSAQALRAGLAGDAAYLLRSAVARIYAQRDDERGLAKTLAEMGTPTQLSLIGPLAPWHLLSFDEATAVEKTGVIPDRQESPFGTLTPRDFSFPDGQFSLSGEPPRGDGYVLAADFQVAESGDFALRTVSASSHKVYIDGTLLTTRRAFDRPLPTVTAQALSLKAGRHRLVVRLAKDDRAGNLSLGLLRLDGSPSNLTFAHARGAPASWSGVSTTSAEGIYPAAADLAEALRGEAGDGLSRFLAARDGLGRDREGAKRLLAPLASAASPAMSSLRAELALGDRTIPSKVGRGRATRDLEAALSKDKGDVHGLLLAATLSLEDGRNAEAARQVKQARAAHTPVGAQVTMLQARVELALGVEAQADATARETLQLLPGHCEALGLRYDVARRRDAVRLADELLAPLAQCPGATSRAAEHARTRGDLARAAALYERLVDRDTSAINNVNALAGLYVAQKRYPQAAKLLSGLRTLWPRNVQLLKRLADVQQLAGKEKEAEALRTEALAIDGSDLSLRRSLERARTGKEPLEGYAIDGKAAIAAYEAQPGTEDATSVYVLDAAAVRAYPDGSLLNRIHVIQKALDQSGVSDVAEVSLPGGAQVLTLRTIKSDGTALEPESIEGKETVSLPGVQVGDYVEYEYLQAEPSRGPGQPGFTAATFYFQIAKQPNHWSTYRVVAPKGSGLSVDAHNMEKVPKITVEGDDEVFFHEERHVPPYIPEPSGPPSSNEYLPLVLVGAGATGNEGVVTAYADAYLDRGQVTFEVESFAKEAVGDKKGLEAVRALYLAVMNKVKGRDAGLGVSASSTVAQDRGSRLWLLKASLEALGIPARLMAVRTFSADPAPYRFPNESLLPYLCLRIDLPDGKGGNALWLDPAVRFAPFGELPELAAGGREAYALPEPGRPLEKTTTPRGAPAPGKQVELTLKLAADGTLSGQGREVYTGFEAAQLAEALESLSPDQRNQALQSALSRYFGGAELSNLKLDVQRALGAPLTVQYDFIAPRFARPEGEKRLVMGALTFPAGLGRRYVQLGSRRTPLYVDSTEAASTRAQVELPSGYVLTGPVPEAKIGNPAFGSFVRRERQKGGRLEVEEDFRLNLARVPPNQYDAFAQFAGEVDLLQARDLVLEKK